METHQKQFDVLIIGSGAAGLSLALRLSQNANIAVITKGPIKECATAYAQGGISAVLNDEDSVAAHVEDTLAAGDGLCDPEIVRFTVEQSKELVYWLVELGMDFTQEKRADGSMGFHLTREGGHRYRRVIHNADTTGKALENTLVQQVRQHPNISVFENHLCIDLITANRLGRYGQRCLGAYVLDRDLDQVDVYAAKTVVLATGGAGKVYLYTSNPDIASGDGIAIGWRAGCRVANMEFIQFHPTCLFHPKAKSFLISEALRGEGGKLILPDGTRFMPEFDPRAELAPRDIVARAIDHVMKRLGIECIFLDISDQSSQFITEHFPNIHRTCLRFGIDITREPIPVVPAAHYTCGGIMTDKHGRTDLPGLYAVGEVAHTGLHGANRMASNSLLECIVFAKAAAADIQAQLPSLPHPQSLPEWDESRVTDSDEVVVVTHNWHELRRFMWDYVGIVRTSKRLQRAKHRIDLLLKEIDEYYGNFRVSSDLIELRNLAQVAQLIIRCAMDRKESRGLHYTLDYPCHDEKWPMSNTVLYPPHRPPMT